MTMVTRPKSLILFDLDGVILDSRRNMEIAWHSVQEECGIALPFEVYFAEIGRPFPDIMARLGLAHSAGAIERVFRRASSQSLHATPLFEGMEAVLATLADSGRQLGIVTSKDAARTELVLDRLSVGFAVVMTPRDGLRGKPAPDHLLSAMAYCNVDPSDSVFIGDMDSDAEAARRARIDYVHVDWGYGARPAGCLFAAAAPADLQTFLLS
ncbi:HAD-IA family hydrolase [Aurantimonas aggregata]|uniref:phosphoglycolate phosphatase n=1 Tax=Aurantimonas aggregata TaxID=2047720 RepID=A0A6L9MJQ1_9HYPH|nr:HAD family hydrolase [Aurantimonas aggregata]NDV88057.1 HAD-IA family hydrolase [Aurantimonas aggregata]